MAKGGASLIETFRFLFFLFGQLFWYVLWLNKIYWTSLGLNSITWPGLFTTKTVGKHRKFISDQKDFIIRIFVIRNFSSVLCHPHFSFRIFPSAFFLSSFYHPHLITDPSPAIHHPVRSLQRPFETCYERVVLKHGMPETWKPGNLETRKPGIPEWRKPGKQVPES